MIRSSEYSRSGYSWSFGPHNKPPSRTQSKGEEFMKMDGVSAIALVLITSFAIDRLVSGGSGA